MLTTRKFIYNFVLCINIALDLTLCNVVINMHLGKCLNFLLCKKGLNFLLVYVTKLHFFQSVKVQASTSPYQTFHTLFPTNSLYSFSHFY